MTYRITDTRNSETYVDDYRFAENGVKGLSDLCIDAGLSNELTYCDIECLLTDGEIWYMLDECGNWAYLPSYYRVDVLR